MKLKNNLSVDAIFDSLPSRYSWYYYHQDKRELIKCAIEEGLEAKYLIDPRFNMGQNVANLYRFKERRRRIEIR